MARKFLISAIVLTFVSFAGAAYAQYGPSAQPAATQAPIARKVLQDTEFPDKYKSTQAYVTIAPGAFVAWHSHPGIEMGYVLDGGGDLMVKGQPTRHVTAGDSFLNPSGAPHALKNGSAVTHVLSVYVVDKSKPLATPEQAPQ
ncbi:MAG: cupin domain-containing protein [Vulcanimicrobiaceae bacterium]